MRSAPPIHVDLPNTADQLIGAVAEQIKAVNAYGDRYGDYHNPVVAGLAARFAQLAVAHASLSANPFAPGGADRLTQGIQQHHEELMTRMYVAITGLQPTPETRAEIAAAAADRAGHSRMGFQMSWASPHANGMANDYMSTHVYQQTADSLQMVVARARADVAAGHVATPQQEPPRVTLARTDIALLEVLSGRLSVSQAAKFYQVPERGLRKQVAREVSVILAQRQHSMPLTDHQHAAMEMMLDGRGRSNYDVLMECRNRGWNDIGEVDVAGIRNLVHHGLGVLQHNMERETLLRQQFNAARTPPGGARSEFRNTKDIKAVKKVLFEGKKVEDVRRGEANRRCIETFVARIRHDALHDRPDMLRPGERLLPPPVQPVAAEATPPAAEPAPVYPDWSSHGPAPTRAETLAPHITPPPAQTERQRAPGLMGLLGRKVDVPVAHPGAAQRPGWGQTHMPPAGPPQTGPYAAAPGYPQAGYPHPGMGPPPQNMGPPHPGMGPPQPAQRPGWSPPGPVPGPGQPQQPANRPGWGRHGG
jgi:hypothetical protein